MLVAVNVTDVLVMGSVSLTIAQTEPVVFCVIVKSPVLLRILRECGFDSGPALNSTALTYCRKP